MEKSDVRFLLKEKYNLSERQILDITIDLEKLEADFPLAYLIGYVDFLDCQIDLQYKPLIPRPETEYWVKKAISEITHKPNLQILDIFAGSGCIGISLLKHLPNCSVTFCDIAENSIKQIAHNIKINNLPSCPIIQSDIFADLKSQKFDYIFANPPYVDKNETYDNSLKYEPETALFAEDNGMNIIKKFLADTTSHLTENGCIYMEFGEIQKDLIQNLPELKKYASIEFFKDQYDKWRYLKVR